MAKKFKTVNTSFCTICYSQKGIALLLVLWVLAVLMVIALSFSFAVRVETSSTISFKEETEKKFLAEACIERGIMEIFYRNINKGQQIVLEGMEVWKTEGTQYEIKVDNGACIVAITDESGKVDLNRASQIILKNLLSNLGLEPQDVDTIVDSIQDWKDPDDLYRPNGAEDDYYMTLSNPYHAKNADFSALEELLLVKGVTADILYGTVERKSLIDFLSINTGTNAININAAPIEILMAVPVMTEQIANDILKKRQIKEIDNLQEVNGITAVNYPLLMSFFRVDDSGTYTIEAVGYISNQKNGYNIKTTVTILGNDTYEYLSYKKGIN